MGGGGREHLSGSTSSDRTEYVSTKVPNDEGSARESLVAIDRKRLPLNAHN